MTYGVVEWVKRSTLEMVSHVERMGSGEFVKVYESELEGPNRRRRPLGGWKDRVEEDLAERAMSGRQRECLNIGWGVGSL